MTKLSIKSSFKELGSLKKWDLYAEKIIYSNKLKKTSSNQYFGGLNLDLVAVTFLGRLNTPILELFPKLKVDLKSENLTFDSFIDEHITNYYGTTFDLIARYVKNYKILFTNSYGERPSFIPIVKTFEEIDKIVPNEVKLKFKWYNPYNVSSNSFDKVSMLDKILDLELESIKSEAENSFRAYLGLKPKTPKWISEQELFDKIKLNFKHLTVISQASPYWLGRQRFDIFIPELNAAIEYNGLQHYKAVGLFGGEEGLIKTQLRDMDKRKKCIENGCHLLEVIEGYSINEVFSWIYQLENKLN